MIFIKAKCKKNFKIFGNKKIFKRNVVYDIAYFVTMLSSFEKEYLGNINYYDKIAVAEITLDTDNYLQIYTFNTDIFKQHFTIWNPYKERGKKLKKLLKVAEETEYLVESCKNDRK